MMADEGASSSSNSIDEVDDGQERKKETFSINFCHSANDNSCTTVSSSGHVASSSQGIVGMSRMSCNPFAIKTSTPTRSVADSTDSKESRPLVAPPTLKLESPGSKIILRPSALAVQAEKLKMNKHDSNSKQEGKENSSDESNILKDGKSVCESNGKISKTELFASGISSLSDITVSSSSKSFISENNTFSLAGKKSGELSPNGSFIFGQNLHERVLNYSSNSEHPSSPPDTHNLTFEEAALHKEELEKMEQRNQEEKMKKSLTESAKEYEARQVKRKFDEVTVITGEEEESNVLQINCKLFAFDKVNMNWQERGRGILRLNDREHNGCLESRVVMRIQGSLRVVLNTKVWAGMSVEHPSQKSVRLTAFDPQGVKVFLVMAQPKDADHLFNALDWRVTTLRSRDLRNKESSSTIEEATSSSSLLDASDIPLKQHRSSSCLDASGIPLTRCSSLSDASGTPLTQNVSSDSCGGADSSSETTYIPPDVSNEGGFADSTDVHS